MRKSQGCHDQIRSIDTPGLGNGFFYLEHKPIPFLKKINVLLRQKREKRWLLGRPPILSSRISDLPL